MLLADDFNERDDTTAEAADAGAQAAEIERLRKINKTLRRKYQEANQEIKHLTKEHDSGKNELLDIIRMQEKDIKFNEKVVQIMLNDSDQYKLRQRSVWDEDTREWTVPLFILHKIQDEVAFPTIGAKARVSQARDEREIEFRTDLNSRFIDSASNRSRSGYNRRDGGGNYSEQNHDDDSLHDPDMQWNKFGAKNSTSMIKNHSKSSQMNNHDGNGSHLRHMSMNNADKIDGVHDRRNKYLGNNSGSAAVDETSSMERSKPYSKHLVPISPPGGGS